MGQVRLFSEPGLDVFTSPSSRPPNPNERRGSIEADQRLDRPRRNLQDLGQFLDGEKRGPRCRRFVHSCILQNKGAILRACRKQQMSPLTSRNPRPAAWPRPLVPRLGSCRSRWMDLHHRRVWLALALRCWFVQRYSVAAYAPSPVRLATSHRAQMA